LTVAAAGRFADFRFPRAGAISPNGHLLPSGALKPTLATTGVVAEQTLPGAARAVPESPKQTFS